MGRKWYRNLLWIRRISFDPVEFYFLWQAVCPPSTSELWEWFWWMCVRKGLQCALKWWLQARCEVVQRQKEGCCAFVCSPAGESHKAHNEPMWETGCRLNTGFVVLMVSATTSGSLISHSKILVLITKPSVFPPCCHLECFPITFPLTRDLNCFLSEQEKNVGCVLL